ncbi:MAG: WecB/TagA/CpsF family glycosyltransferase [Pseudomonadota bacterium]
MSLPFDRDVWAVFGMPIDNVTLDQAVTLIERAVKTRARLSFVTPNVNWMVRALREPHAMRQIIQADLSLADGWPVVWLARRLGMPLKERAAGADLFERLRRRPSDDAVPIRVFFFGGRRGAAQRAYDVISQEGGHIVAAGWHNPGYGNLDSMSTDKIIAQINAAKPDFVLVSLGAAKGQDWIERNQDALDAPVIAHLGAVVDFVAGTVRRAPRFLRAARLEWAWRILADPSLWRRYWADGRAILKLTNGRMNALKKASRPGGAAQPVWDVMTHKTLKLHGDLVHSEREALRVSMSRLSEISGDLTLDLTAINSIDASGLGQIRMLEQVSMARGNQLSIHASHQIKPALRAANMTA